MKNCNIPERRDDLHELANRAIRVRDQLSIRSTLEDDTTSNVCELIKTFEICDAVGNENSSFCGKETLGADDVV